MKFYEFHDTKLSNIVENAYHALAIDEHRQDYTATLWNPDTAPQQTLEQRWFIGAHCDVGGGYNDRRLSDVTLNWMQQKASALGLAVDTVQVGPKNCLGELIDSYAKFLGGLYAKKNARHYRSILACKFGNEFIDESAQQRRKEDTDYEPQNNGLPKLN
jgi:T6SS, Phospholipase effector Tle1-like, catalytic domain